MPLAPLITPDDPPSIRRRRIVRGIARELAAFAGLTLLAPVVLLAAALVDLALWLARRKPSAAVRIAVLVWCFLWIELRGLAGVLCLWVLTGGPFARDTAARRRRVFRLQVDWGADVLAVVVRLWRVRVEVAGSETLRPGPFVLLHRHASLLDGALASEVLGRRNGLELRYVLKAEMQALPSLDIGARWVPTAFVRRASGDAARELASVRRLGRQLEGEREVAMIYPEGTVFTPAKLARLQAAPETSLRERALGLSRVLPPRHAGTLALLEEAPHADVVICGQTGMAPLSSPRALWNGRLLGSTVHVRYWRIARHDLPTAPAELGRWLDERWRSLDAWVAETEAAA